MKKRSLGILCASLAICGTAVFGTYAWLTATDTPLTNEFRTKTDSKSIAIDLTEPKWDETGKTEAENYLPGSKIAKDPQVTNISNAETVYVAVKVSFEVSNGQVMNKTDMAKFNEIASFDAIDSKWKHIGRAEDGISDIYMYESIVEKGATTNPIFNMVNVKNDLKATLDFNVTVHAYGTQARNATKEEARVSLLAMAKAADVE